jgi:hypothetical protein
MRFIGWFILVKRYCIKQRSYLATEMRRTVKWKILGFKLLKPTSMYLFDILLKGTMFWPILEPNVSLIHVKTRSRISFLFLRVFLLVGLNHIHCS